MVAKYRFLIPLGLSFFLFVVGDYSIWLAGYGFDRLMASRLVRDYLPFRGIILFLFNLLGILSYDLLLTIKRHKASEKLKWADVLSDTVHSRSFFESVLYAPLVLYVFYFVAKDQPDTELITNLLFAYQNGFFWKTVRSCRTESA